MSDVLRLQDVHFAYRGGAPVLRGVSLELSPGEVVGLVGPNGGGKTTLLRCAAGLLNVTSGNVLYDDRPLRELAPRIQATHRSYAAQTVDYPFPYSVAEAVSMGLAHRSALFLQPDASKEVRAVLDELGCDVGLTARVDQLSGGQKQLVLLARALIQGSRALLLDEPTSALDLRHAARALRALRQRASQGSGVLISIHNLNMAAQVSDRLIFLHEGKVLRQGPSREVITQELLDEVYGAGVVRVLREGTSVRVDFRALDPSHEKLKGEDEVPVVPAG